MERFKTLLALRTTLRRLLGGASTDALSGQSSDRYNGYLNLAHEEVITLRNWRASEREYSFTFGVAGRFYNYPPNCRGQGVISVAVWSNGVDNSSGEWLPLRKRPIGVQLNSDPIESFGGDAAAATRSMPSRWQPKNQIEVWPPADIPYLGRIIHTVSPELLVDTDLTVVDSTAVLHLALSYGFNDKKNYKLADVNEAKGQKRAAFINGWTQAGEVVHLDDDANFDECETIIDPLMYAERRPG